MFYYSWLSDNHNDTKKQKRMHLSIHPRFNKYSFWSAQKPVVLRCLFVSCASIGWSREATPSSNILEKEVVVLEVSKIHRRKPNIRTSLGQDNFKITLSQVPWALEEGRGQVVRVCITSSFHTVQSGITNIFWFAVTAKFACLVFFMGKIVWTLFVGAPADNLTNHKTMENV